MEKGKFIVILKAVLAAYVVTALLLFLLTLLVYRFQMPERAVEIGICVLYICAGLVAGLIIGKRTVKKRFLWGLLAGAAYFIILLVVSLIAGHPVVDQTGRTVFVLFLCGISGMLGGMLS